MPQEDTLQDNLLASPKLLLKIDKLRERNIGKHVPLPQLVVVGDQSSGKSSLLESLTGIPFPRDVGLCTRYATQITQRRDNSTHVNITIIPGPRSTDEHKSHVETYYGSALSGDDLRAKFPAILQEVNARMGIRLSSSAKGGTVFSEDILKIEICGPKEDYLTVIDVPGIFRNPTEGVTTKQDIDMVRNMVTEYIRDNRTIILAVLPCNIDIANQEILTLAEEYDQKGERTLGILTKPDLVLEDSSKNAICSIVENKRKQLTLGYYVVRGRGADQDDSGYESREQMFNEDPWRRLDKGRVGVRALKAKLGELLGDMARREFPKLRKDIGEMLSRAEKERDGLGPSRGNDTEQRIFLSHIADKFQELVKASLEARYYHDPAFETSLHLKLATLMAFLAENFSREFEVKAAYRNFENRNSDDDYDGIDENVKNEMNLLQVLENSSVCPSSSSAASEAVRMLESATQELDPGEFPELHDIICDEYEVGYPEDGIMDWITNLYVRSRGMELGHYSDAVQASAWKEQSKKWPVMSRVFASRAIMIIQRFIANALSIVCTDSALQGTLWSCIQEEVLQRYRRATCFLEYLLSVEREFNPYTLNKHFSKARQEALADRAADHILSTLPGSMQDAGDNASITIGQIRSSTKDKSNIQDVAEQLHDGLSSYYDVARKRFVDNVWAYVVQSHLLFGPNTPLKVFTQDWVIGLNAEQLEAIAGESSSVKEQRANLARKIEDLKEAKKILQF
ncbi:P-loop containing nucleoside triphosphate hydrolase protein [Triangularia setosa]|uniref:P-loop containing nucleoside triphosphate hydrolase protein n=1 Tax=Triangularia setosa TaxID=2587417 RepID=A0AAN6WFC2_9PEZI|nr:P-loop containing nucleoside triphosphate hydrolase protein [Podospora setosa]